MSGNTDPRQISNKMYKFIGVLGVMLTYLNIHNTQYT